MTYEFFRDKDYLGELSIDNITKAKDIANSIGANKIYSSSPDESYRKCSNCGCWENTHILVNGLCVHCDYLRKIENWLDFYSDELASHLDGEIDNYGEEFLITFKGKELRLQFGPDEDQYFIDGIRGLLNNYKEELEAIEE